MNYSLFLRFVVALCLIVATSASAAPKGKRPSADKVFQELYSQYLSLRNTDVNLVRAAEWESLAKRFGSFAGDTPKHPKAANALFYSSILYEHLYKKFGGDDRVNRSVGLLEVLARDYPGHLLVDDGLVRRGDLLLFVLHQEEEAKRSYLEVVEAYPHTDMYEVARARLASISTGSYKKKVVRKKSKPAAVAARSQKPLVVIDPGHGGEDFGAVGKYGLLEKDVALAVALQLEKLITDNLDVVVRLTRRSDIFVPLMDRTNLANDFEADLFISLHVNASPKGKLSGFETFYLDNSGDKSSKKLAERENASVKFEGAQGDLQYMLSDLIQNAKLDDSIALANIIHKTAIQSLKPKHKRLRDLGVRKAPFYVLVGAHMPCILVEMFFIDNALDAPLLASRKFRGELAQSLFKGVAKYFERVG